MNNENTGLSTATNAKSKIKLVTTTFFSSLLLVSSILLPSGEALASNATAKTTDIQSGEYLSQLVKHKKHHKNRNKHVNYDSRSGSDSDDNKFSFAVLPDLDYVVENPPGSANPLSEWAVSREESLQIILDINNDKDIEFVVGVGDWSGFATRNLTTKAEALDFYQAKLDLFFNELNKPFIPTLGDNDWAENTTIALDVLDAAREKLFSTNETLGKQVLSLKRQARYPENALLVYKDLVIASVHIIGPDDTAKLPEPDKTKERLNRQAANIKWIREAFRTAKRVDAIGILFVSHADKWKGDVYGKTDVTDGNLNGAKHPNYDAYIEAWREECLDFGFVTYRDTEFFLPGSDILGAVFKQPLGGLPVLNATGDGHVQGIRAPMPHDVREILLTSPPFPQGLIDVLDEQYATITNYQEVLPRGPINANWIKVTVDPSNSLNMFSFTPMVPNLMGTADP